MKRRDFLLSSTRVAAASALGMGPHALLAAEADPTAPPWRQFKITTTVQIARPVGRTVLWLPLPWSRPTSYQRVLKTRHHVGPGARVDFLTTATYDVAMMRVEWPDARSVGPVSLTHWVATRDRAVALGVAPAASHPAETLETLQTYLRPTALLPTDGIVRQTAQQITAGHHGDIQKARAIYDWVVQNTTRDPRTPGCGVGDVVSMLKSGYLGGKCADINALFVALARSVSIPARDAYGVRVAASRRGFKCLGHSGDITKAQHCRAELYARGIGWVPVDPADVRKIMLEEVPGGLPLSDPRVQAARAALFGSWEMNWIAYNHGHDVVLPGSRAPAIPFLMYPTAETAAGRIDSLDPASFRYEIHSQPQGTVAIIRA